MHFFKIIMVFSVLISCICSSCKSKKSNNKSIETTDSNYTKLTPESQNDKPSVVVAYPGVIEYVLPDGYILLIYLEGDEHGSIAKTTDGYYLLINEEGYYEYAVKDNDKLSLSGVRAHNKEDRSPEENSFLKELGH